MLRLPCNSGHRFRSGFSCHYHKRRNVATATRASCGNKCGSIIVRNYEQKCTYSVFCSVVEKSTKISPNKTAVVVREFSSSSTKVLPPSSKWRSRLKYLVRILKYLRIPLLVGSVYNLGNVQGQMAYAANPEKIDSLLIESVLRDHNVNLSHVRMWTRNAEWMFRMRDASGISSYGNSHIAWHPVALGQRDVRLKRIADVGKKILAAAKVKVEEEYQAYDEKDAELKALMKMADRSKVQALCKIKDQFNNISSWQFILIDSEEANAFVVEVLPRRIFVTTSFIDDFIENEHELALIIGHELSHLILGHSSKKIYHDKLIRTAEIFLLSIDPTEGLVSASIMAGIILLREMYLSAHSRDSEEEADRLGITLSAMACYDTQKGAQVMKKLSKFAEAEDGAVPTTTGWFDSHPPSMERYEYLQEASLEENRLKYKDYSCCSMPWDTKQSSIFYRLLGRRGA